MKPRLNVYLDPDLLAKLHSEAQRRRRSASGLIQLALRSWLDPQYEQQREAAITRRLDDIRRKQTRHDWFYTVLIEMLAADIRGRLVSPDEPATQARFDAFIERLAVLLEPGRGIIAGLENRLMLSADDYPPVPDDYPEPVPADLAPDGDTA